MSRRLEEKRLRDEYEEDMKLIAREELYGRLHFDVESTKEGIPMATQGFLSPERIQILKALWQEQHPWALHCKSFADYEPEPYGGRGQWRLLYWAMTGDEVYGRGAVTDWLGMISGMSASMSRNETREHTIHFAARYADMLPLMNEAERLLYEKTLRLWAELILNQHAETRPWGTRPGDSDEVVGHYFGLAAIDKVLGSSYLADPQCRVMESEIRRYCGLAQGGEWVESGEYNLGTMQLLVYGAWYHGLEKWPEVRALASQFAEQLEWLLTPDEKEMVQWGDEQDPHHVRLSHLIACAGACASVGETKALPFLKHLTIGLQPYGYWMAIERLIQVLDPRLIDETPDTWKAPEGFRTTGVGLSIARGEGYLLQAHNPPDLGVDHMMNHSTDLRLWYDGEWVLDHPIGYMPETRCFNTVRFCSFGRMTKHSHAAAATEKGCLISISDGGLPYLPPYDNPPTEFLKGWQRTVDFDATTLTLRVKDSFSGRLPDFEKENYVYPGVRDAMRAREGLWEVIYHTASEPKEVSPGVFEWATKKGRKVRLTARGHEKAVVIRDSRETLSAYFHDYEVERWSHRIVLVSDANEAEIETTFETLDIGEIPPPPPPPTDPTEPPPTDPTDPTEPPPPPPPAEWVKVGQHRMEVGDIATETVVYKKGES